MTNEAAETPGIGRIDFAVAAAFFLTAFAVFWYQTSTRDFISYPDAMEYAQLAENLAEGRGRVSQTQWILQTAYNTDIPSPDLRRSPGLPVMQALVFKLTGKTDDQTAIRVAGIFWVLAIPLLFLFARTFLPFSLSVVGAIFLLLDPLLLFFLNSGLTEHLFALLILILGMIVFQRNHWVAAIAGGFVLGLAQYVRSNSFTLIVPLLFVLWLREGSRREKLRWCGITIIVFFATTSPELLRNMHYLGRADYTGYQSAVLINDVDSIPLHYAERSFDRISPIGSLIEAPLAIAAKLWEYGLKNTKFAQAANPPVVTGLAFGALLLLPLLRPGERRLAVFGPFCLMWSVLFFSFGELQGPRFYIPFTPLLILGALLVVRRLMNVVHLKKWWWAGAIVLMIASLLPGFGQMLQPEPSDPMARLTRESFGRIIRENVGENEVVASDVPWVVGRYAKRTCFWLPVYPKEMDKFKGRLQVKWVCLSPSIYQLDYVRPEWRKIYEDPRAFPGYQLVPGLESGFVLYRRIDSAQQ